MLNNDGLVNENLTRQTIRRIRDIIISSGLKPGDKFATEGELQEKLNVSRSLLREAVSALKILGYLKSKQYVGLTVSTPDPIGLFEEVLNIQTMDQTDIQELSELRYAIELGSVDLAIMNVTREQVMGLYKLIDELQESIDPKSDSRPQDEIDLDIHIKMLEATHNAKIMRLHHVLVSFFNRAPIEQADWVEHQYDNQFVQDHRFIVEALSDGNVESLRVLLANHLAGLLPRSNQQKK